jgi:ATP-dependent DNA helicase RecQ
MNALFQQNLAIEDLMHQSNLARSTVMDYLARYISSERPASIRAWVDEETYQRVAEAVRQVGTDRLKPIFIALGEKVGYDLIRLVLAHLATSSGDPV